MRLPRRRSVPSVAASVAASLPLSLLAANAERLERRRPRRFALRRDVGDEHVVDAYYQFLVLVVVSSVPRRFRGLRQLPAR